MGFWIFMFLMDLLIPLTMVVLGKRFMSNPPKKINAVFGYRTAMSMKNNETWKFAHKYCGKLWFLCGLALLPISIIPMLFVFNKGSDVIGVAGGIICMIQLFALIGSIFPTETALRKTFDENGIRR